MTEPRAGNAAIAVESAPSTSQRSSSDEAGGGWPATPLRYARGLSAACGADVWLKLETGNPTGTHKDRESRRIVADCRARGYQALGCASTGNFAVSLAYYAWLEGLSLHVWVAPGAAAEVVHLLEAFSARVHVVRGDLARLYETSSRALAAMGAYDANPRRCPAKIAGNAALGREISAQLPGVDKVLCPINNGSLFLGVDRGLAPDVELIGVYSHDASARAIHGFRQAEGQRRITAAVARRGGSLIEAVRQDIRHGAVHLMREGVIAEPASATVAGVLERLAPAPGETVCCIVTGSGLKASHSLNTLLGQHHTHIDPCDNDRSSW